MKVWIFTKNQANQAVRKKLKKSCRLFYLSEDFLTLKQLEQNSGQAVTFETLGPAFHSKVKELRQAFLNLGHQINESNQGDGFWGTPMASRHTISFNLFTYLVYLECFKDLCSKNQNSFCVIVDSPALAQCMKQAAKQMGLAASARTGIKDRLINFTGTMKSLIKGFLFLSKNLYLWAALRRLKNLRISSNAKNVYILRTWVTKGCINTSGTYKNRNYGDLQKHLEEKGFEVWILPMLFNLGTTTTVFLKKLTASGQKFLLPEQYLLPQDFVKSFARSFGEVFRSFDKFTFRTTEISNLLKELHVKTCCYQQAMELNLVYELAPRLKNKGIELKYFLYPIENNYPEKPAIRAFKRSFPECQIVGFQHSVWFQDQLGMYLHPDEANYHPIPDKIICSGSEYPRIISEAGFPEKLSLKGANLRFVDANQAWTDTSSENNIQKVLVLLNIYNHQPIQLLDLTLRAAKKLKNVEVLVKPHPANDLKTIQSYLDKQNIFPYKLLKGSVQEHLMRSNVAVMAANSVSYIETIGVGKPVITVQLDNVADLDPLWETYPYASKVCTPDSLASEIQKVFALNTDQLEEIKNYGTKIKDKYFEPVNAENLRPFME